MKNIVILSALALCALPIACDAVEETEPRDAQVAVAVVEEIDYARKLIQACFAFPHEAEIAITVNDPFNDGLQPFRITIDSQAPVKEVACAFDIVSDWGMQP